VSVTSAEITMPNTAIATPDDPSFGAHLGLDHGDRAVTLVTAQGRTLAGPAGFGQCGTC
jgi:hypothetical protein